MGNEALMNTNLESLIQDHASMLAERMLKAVEWAGSEEDIRHEVNKLIDEFIEKARLTVKGRHEYGLAGGRIDSKYGGVVIEYKDPMVAGSPIWEMSVEGISLRCLNFNNPHLDGKSQENQK